MRHECEPERVERRSDVQRQSVVSSDVYSVGYDPSRKVLEIIFHSGGVDIKAYAMGKLGCSWQATSSSRLPAEFRASRSLNHNALDDAIVQGEVFAKLLTTRT